MKTLQRTGPFSKGEEIEILPPRSDDTFVHLGVQVPYSWPIQTWATKDATQSGSKIYPQIFSLRERGLTGGYIERGFCINANGVLEFCGFAKDELVLIAKEDLPEETIIDAVYKTVEDE